MGLAIIAMIADANDSILSRRREKYGISYKLEDLLENLTLANSTKMRN